MSEVDSTVETVFREQCGRVTAALIRISGSFDRAEEAVQEAFAAALASWPAKGVPDNPGAWIMATAHRRLIDSARRDRTRRDKQDQLQYHLEGHGSSSNDEPDYAAMEYPDDRLRLICTCCHPALSEDARVALTLRTLGGLTTGEIAKAFLVPEPTLAQRLVRAKRKIEQARIPYETPPPDRLPERLSSVRAVIYLIFNEGYASHSGDQLVRNDLCVEAIRLGRLLCELLPHDSENLALSALMMLHHSRRRARLRDGALVTLEDQDRCLWDRDAIAEGLRLLDRAIAQGPPGPYWLQAAISAAHARAASAAETDWKEIAALYGKLFELNPSPVIALNRGVAIAMSEGPAAGLRYIDQIGGSGVLDNYYLFHAARADLLRRMQRLDEAAPAYGRALQLVTNPVERAFLTARLADVTKEKAATSP
jgi:RNA polymerase sigma-70 factor (ECF subfamily)